MSDPMYILVPYNPDEELDVNDVFDEHYLYTEGDFVAEFGFEGYVSSKEIHDTKEKRSSVAEKIIRYFGKDICHLEDDTVVFEKDVSLKYAEKKIKKINDLMKEMTSEKYVEDGEFRLIDAIRTMSMYIHAWNTGYDEFIQSADSFVIDTLNYNDDCKFWVAQTWFCHY